MPSAIAPSPSPSSATPSPADGTAKGGFGIYIHWPFCAAKCPYCDFNSHVSDAIDHDAWRDAYLAELRHAAAETSGQRVGSVYFGGGTPSLMAPETVAAILDTVAGHWPLADDMEVTLEANPTSVEAGRFQGFRAGGVNRVSVGVQALNDTDLHRLGRRHSVAEALSAVQMARSTFERVSMDLIYARQDQSPAAWQAELGRALELGGDHLSLYQLTVEPGTAFGDRFARGRLAGLPDEDAGADMYDITQDLCEAAGLPAYEVSNHAAPGAEGRHNLTYWRGGDYVGIGPGAHGRLGLGGHRLATETHLNPAEWLRAVRADGSGEVPRVNLKPLESAEEYLMMSLRLREGTDCQKLAALGLDVPKERVAELVALGLLTDTGDRIATTAQGRPVLNGILRHLLAG